MSWSDPENAPVAESTVPEPLAPAPRQPPPSRNVPSDCTMCQMHRTVMPGSDGSDTRTPQLFERSAADTDPARHPAATSPMAAANTPRTLESWHERASPVNHERSTLRS